MRLNKRKVEDVTQYLTENGKVVADFYRNDIHAIFALGIVSRKDLTIYDMDRKEVVYGTLDELLLEPVPVQSERLRIAAQIMSGLVSGHDNDDLPNTTLAEWSLNLADALIKEARK